MPMTRLGQRQGWWNPVLPRVVGQPVVGQPPSSNYPFSELDCSMDYRQVLLFFVSLDVSAFAYFLVRLCDCQHADTRWGRYKVQEMNFEANHFSILVFRCLLFGNICPARLLCRPFFRRSFGPPSFQTGVQHLYQCQVAQRGEYPSQGTEGGSQRLPCNKGSTKGYCCWGIQKRRTKQASVPAMCNGLFVRSFQVFFVVFKYLGFFMCLFWVEFYTSMNVMFFFEWFFFDIFPRAIFFLSSLHILTPLCAMMHSVLQSIVVELIWFVLIWFVRIITFFSLLSVWCSINFKVITLVSATKVQCHQRWTG